MQLFQWSFCVIALTFSFSLFSHTSVYAETIYYSFNGTQLNKSAVEGALKGMKQYLIQETNFPPQMLDEGLVVGCGSIDENSSLYKKATCYAFLLLCLTTIAVSLYSYLISIWKRHKQILELQNLSAHPELKQ